MLPILSGSTCIAVLAVTLSVSQLHGQAPEQQKRGRPARVESRGSWQTLRTVGLDSDLFQSPIGLAVNGESIVVLDADNVVKSVRFDGRVEWKAGGIGRGPGQFTSPVSVATDGVGNVLVFDPGNGRLTTFDRAGKLSRTVPLQTRTDRAVFAAPAGNYLLLHTTSDSLARLVDTLGAFRVVTRVPSDIRSIGGIAREMAGVVPSPGGYVVAFRWSSRMLLLDRGGTILRTCIGADSLTFPAVVKIPLKLKVAGITNLRVERVDPRANEAATMVAAFENGSAVLRPPAATGHPRTIDLYAADCGRYLETRPFPFVSRHIAGNGNTLVAIVAEPVPHLALLRWTAK